MTRHVQPHAWRNLVLASAIGYSPSSEPAPGDEPPHVPAGEPGREEPGRCDCGEPSDEVPCFECVDEAAKALTCRHCGEECEPEQERCCERATCMGAERYDRRST